MIRKPALDVQSNGGGLRLSTDRCHCRGWKICRALKFSIRDPIGRPTRFTSRNRRELSRKTCSRFGFVRHVIVEGAFFCRRFAIRSWKAHDLNTRIELSGAVAAQSLANALEKMWMGKCPLIQSPRILLPDTKCCGFQLASLATKQAIDRPSARQVG